MAARAREGATKQGARAGGAQLQPDSRRMNGSLQDKTAVVQQEDCWCSVTSALPSAPSLSLVSLLFDDVVFWEMRPRLIQPEVENFKNIGKLKTRKNQNLQYEYRPADAPDTTTTSSFDVRGCIVCALRCGAPSGESRRVSALCCKGPSFLLGVGDERAAIGQARYRNTHDRWRV